MWCVHTFGLMFLLLPLDEVGDYFSEKFIEDLLSDERVPKYADYLVDKYILGSASKFPAEMLAENSEVCRSILMLANIFIHTSVNDSFYHTHPPLYTFLSSLGTFKIETYIKIKSLGYEKGK